MERLCVFSHLTTYKVLRQVEIKNRFYTQVSIIIVRLNQKRKECNCLSDFILHIKACNKSNLFINPFTAAEKCFFEKHKFRCVVSLSEASLKETAASKQLFFVGNLVYFQKI